MNNKEAIRKLTYLNFTAGFQSAIDHAIKQLEKVEIWNDPVNMEVKDFEHDDDDWTQRRVIGKLNGRYIADSDTLQDTFQLWDEARPIKKEPVSFGRFLEDFDSSKKNTEFFDEAYKEYQQYLEEFND